MTKNFDLVLKDLDGTIIKTNGEKDFTMKDAVINALLQVFPDEQNLEGTEKLKRYNLATRIHKGGDLVIETEEIALIKKLIGKAYGPIVVGPIYQHLEK